MKKLVFTIFTENMSIGASMLAALSRESGWDPDIFFVPKRDGQRQLEDYLDEHRPDIVAVSFKSYERHQAFEAAKLAKTFGIKTIAGGIHPTFLPEDVARCGHFDGIVIGDGMGNFAEVLDRYDTLRDSVLIQGREHPDKARYLDYFYSSSMEDRLRTTRSILFLSAFGCPYKCTFCCSGRIASYAYPVRTVVKSMHALNQKYGVTNFQVNDEVFASSAKRIRAFRNECRAFFPNGVGLSSFVSARVNTFSDDIADELKALGITTVGFGIETPSPRLLGFLKKNQKEDDCYRAIEICKRNDLVSSVNLLFGLPTQDESDYESAYRFVENAAPDKCALYYYSPYPGTDLYDYCFDHGFIGEGIDRRFFDWFEPENDGVMTLQYRLANIDYDMAASYMTRIKSLMTSRAQVTEKISLIDQKPWVLAGMSNHYYFKSLLSDIAELGCRNFFGYVDLNDKGSYAVDAEIKKYDTGQEHPPSAVVTYCFIGGGDYAVVEDYVDKAFTGTPLISIASYRNNSLDEIGRMLDV